METEITLPQAIPVMTLPGIVLFPQALLPLHIFEPRYRQMLRDVLATHRIFAVARLNEALAAEPGQYEPLHRVATAGIIRACQKNENGTSNLLLQGLCRVEFTEILHDKPYRCAHVRPLASTPGAASEENRRLRQELARLLSLKRRFGATMSDEMTAFLRTVEDPATFVDLAAFGFCEDASVKQKLLETLDTHRRLQLFSAQVRAEIEAIKLRRKLQGPLGDDAVSNN
jgi:Lon protease-like protein